MEVEGQMRVKYCGGVWRVETWSCVRVWPRSTSTKVGSDGMELAGRNETDKEQSIRYNAAEAHRARGALRLIDRNRLG
jgi:hypothetical protein